MKTRVRWTKRIASTVLALAMAITVVVSPMPAQAAPVEVAQAALGIDVSRYQGMIDWSQVAASGVQFAMVRVGYRTQATGMLNEDPYARYNLQEATKYGIKVGAYFFSTAVTAAEAVEEAMFTANILDKYAITYPVAFDCEGYRSKSSRQYPLDKASRTALAITFMDTIASRGYTPMFYSSKSEMENNKYWDMTTIGSKYKVWAAWYPTDPFPITTACTYSGVHAMWQYTQKAAIAGIAGEVDMNVAYFNYTEAATPKDPSGAEPVQPNLVNFTEVYEVVTPNTTTLNLRTVPSTDSADTIVVKIKAGDMIFRTGVGNNGWSRVVLNGQVLYAYSNYLTKVL